MEPGPFTCSFTCAVCQRVHAELPHLSVDAPEPWFRLPEAERESRATLTSDTCMIAPRDATRGGVNSGALPRKGGREGPLSIDEEHFFLRGLIELPVHDYPEPFAFNGWVSQSRAHFEAYLARPAAEDRAPTYGYLSTELDCYPVSTLLLKIRVHFRGGGLRPRFELEPTQHPLAVEQRTGITLARACELLHHDGVDLDPEIGPDPSRGAGVP